MRRRIHARRPALPLLARTSRAVLTLALFGRVVAGQEARPFVEDPELSAVLADVYAEEKILGPLGMTDSGFEPDERMRPREATGYGEKNAAGVREPFVWQEFGVASGMLCSTAPDLTRFLMLFFREGPRGRNAGAREQFLRVLQHEPVHIVRGDGLRRLAWRLVAALLVPSAGPDRGATGRARRRTGRRGRGSTRDAAVALRPPHGGDRRGAARQPGGLHERHAYGRAPPARRESRHDPRCQPFLRPRTRRCDRVPRDPGRNRSGRRGGRAGGSRARAPDAIKTKPFVTRSLCAGNRSDLYALHGIACSAA